MKENHTMETSDEPFLGQIILFAGNYAPRGWTICNGSLLSLRENNALFSLLGTIYGGDGYNTFGIPDLRGRMAVGAGAGPGLTPRELGEQGGVESVGLTVANMPSHTHAANAVKLATQSNPSSDRLWGGSPSTGTPLFSNGRANCQLSPGAIGSSGGLDKNSPQTAELHNNMAPFLPLTYLICISGVYPTRD